MHSHALSFFLEAILEETKLIEFERESLKPTKIIVNGILIEQTHELFMTMVEKKIANALTDNLKLVDVTNAYISHRSCQRLLLQP